MTVNKYRQELIALDAHGGKARWMNHVRDDYVGGESG